MGTCTCVVRRVEQIVEGGRLEVAGVVVFHGLEIQFSRLSHATVAAAETVTKHRAGDVGTVARVLVGGAAVTDDIVGTDDSGAKIAVVFVKTGIRHRHNLT